MALMSLALNLTRLTEAFLGLNMVQPFAASCSSSSLFGGRSV